MNLPSNCLFLDFICTTSTAFGEYIIISTTASDLVKSNPGNLVAVFAGNCTDFIGTLRNFPTEKVLLSVRVSLK